MPDVQRSRREVEGVKEVLSSRDDADDATFRLGNHGVSSSASKMVWNGGYENTPPTEGFAYPGAPTSPVD
jgi:hypothetical protein